MLKLRRATFVLAGCWLVAVQALAREKKCPEPRALREPVRLTAGASNQLMGVLTPDGSALYFVSDRNATAEVFVQDPADSGPRLLFDSNADVSWPRVSPDGKRLAYISHKTDATGDLCVMNLAEGEHRCLTGLGSSELQALWMDKGQKLAVLTRVGMHADYQLRRFDPNASGSAGQLIVERNMLGPALSADGRWLAYVPLERTTQQVGVNFSNRAGGGLHVQRMPVSGKPFSYQPDLPGVTGFPAFSRDGHSLYFSQYLNDTNRDGVIDGNDHSILFRVRFDPEREPPVTAAFPEQLTNAHWNCRYPAPAADRLVLTCSHQGSLDIYSLPLDGSVPGEWNAERVRGELHVARNHWTRLLLLGRLLNLATDKTGRVEVLRQMVQLHVELREYESAIFYCDQIQKLAGEASSPSAAWAMVMQELARHRREDIALTHGQLSDQFVASERDRAARLQALVGKVPRNIEALVWLAVSEIQDNTGAKGRSLETFAKVNPSRVDDPLVLQVAAWCAERIHTLRADRQSMLLFYRDLSQHPALPILDRLRFAERFIHELTRGVPRPRRPMRVRAWIEKLNPESELRLLLQVTGWLLQLDQEGQEKVRKGIFGLYKQNKDTDRRRALVLATIRTAARLGNEYLQYQFATSWASWLRRDNPERKYAEALYRQVVLERAYTELARDKISQARGYFFGTTMQTDSLEAHIGFIQAMLLEGKGDIQATYAKRFKGNADHPVHAFIQAYLIARGLTDIDDDLAHDQAIERAIALVQSAARALPRSMEVHQLWGYLLHQRYIRSASKQDAATAHSHYLLALDLARSNPRIKASLDQQIGLLQASLGNHRIALEYFSRRDRLPHVRPEGELNLCMALARGHFHVGGHDQAVQQAERALKIVDANQELHRYRPLVMDRLALYWQVAGRHEDSLELYTKLKPVVEGAGKDDMGALVNRIKVRLGMASAAISAGRYRLAVDTIEEIEKLTESGEPLRPPGQRESLFDEHRYTRDDYAILLAGLKAQAHRGMEHFDAAIGAMQRRQELVARRFEDTDTDEDLLELALTSYHLGEYSFRDGKLDQALWYLERGLAHSASYNQRTGSSVNDVGLRLLQAYAELHLYKKVNLQKYRLDLKEQIEKTYTFICEHPSPSWAADRFLLGLYLTMLEVG